MPILQTALALGELGGDLMSEAVLQLSQLEQRAQTNMRSGKRGQGLRHAQYSGAQFVLETRTMNVPAEHVFCLKRWRRSLWRRCLFRPAAKSSPGALAERVWI